MAFWGIFCNFSRVFFRQIQGSQQGMCLGVNGFGLVGCEKRIQKVNNFALVSYALSCSFDYIVFLICSVLALLNGL